MYKTVYIKRVPPRLCKNYVHTMPLTDAWLKATAGKPREKTLEKADRDGLSVRVSPKGRITYQMRYRYSGKPTRLDLGSYPLLSLKDAREEAQRLRAKHEQGENPQVVKKVERQVVMDAPTFEELCRQWMEKACSKEKKGHADILRSFELHVFPRVGTLPANQITLHQWLEILEDLAARVPGIAERVLSNTKECYWWGVKRKLVPDNPLSNLDGRRDLQITRKEQVRPLSDTELWYIWHALQQSRISLKNRLIMKLCLAYACRWSEFRLARKEHFDFAAKVWTVPPENHKNGWRTGKPLQRPILPHTKEMLEQAFKLSAGHESVFISDRTKKVLCESAQTSWTYEIQKWVYRHCGVMMDHWTIHDFRATARTKFSELTDPHIAEKMVGHRLPGVWELYDRYGYLDEQAKAYTLWWELLQGIVTRASGSQSVLPTPARAR